MWQRFAIYGMLGWITEIIWTGLGSLVKGDWNLTGYSYLWMFPIYGLAVFFEPIHDAMRRYPWYFRGLVWLAGIWLVEYVTGWAIEMLVGRVPWDYTAKTAYHIKGLIRLDYAPVWFGAGLLFEKLHDYLDRVRIIKVR
ncbi:MAG: hypothetical protein H0Z35_07420 [Thermoanaerobacteraceae bacterium]|nr:hypothetical protein [Thermoanaerobacteraceae bacterium]